MISLSELEHSYALSTEAGWNQTPNDWRRILTLTGEARFSITAGDTLAATTVAILYSKRLAWIGMVLTAVQHRGKGFARTLMRQALDYLDRRGVACIKLDATEMGRPVYARLGFVDERPVTRWRREPGARVAPAPALEVQSAWSNSLLALDLEMFGADRSPLLRLLAEEEAYVAPGAGFAFARPGRTAWYFGPCVSRDAETARALLAAFLVRHAGEPSFLDACDDHPGAVSMAEKAGYRPARRLMRMLRGDASCAQLASGPGIYALAGFEFG
jgi:GNAT superfamily N-acetyltransferase